MIYGLYLSAQGAQIQSTRQDVIANNLANAATNSFKRDFVRVQSHQPYDVTHGGSTSLPNDLQKLTGGTTPTDVATDFSQGMMTSTRSPLDVAINGKGFIRVVDGKKNYLTRDGQLAINAQGQLVTREHGYHVLATTGQPLSGFNQETPIEIKPDGTVGQGEDQMGQIAIVEPTSYNTIQKVGQNMYTCIGKLVPPKGGGEVKQGFVENSGTQPVTEMMDLIESSRAFESNINMIKSQDDALGRLLGSLPRH